MTKAAKKATRVRGRVLTFADLGDGKPVNVWVELSNLGITVRKFHGRTRFFVPFPEAAGIIGRRGQIRLVQMLTGGGTSRSSSAAASSSTGS